MVIPKLSREHGSALIEEVSAIRNLLGYGVGVLRTTRLNATTRDPILTLLSIGVEKLYKITLGLIALDVDNAWLPANIMKAYRHNVVKLHEDVWRALDSRTASSSDYVRRLVVAVQSDPVALPLMAALDRYGRQGRFYYIDTLGGETQPLESPESYWDEVERVARLDTGVRSLFIRGGALVFPGVDMLVVRTDGRSMGKTSADRVYDRAG